MKKFFVIFSLIFVFAALIISSTYYFLFTAPISTANPQLFTVTKSDTLQTLSDRLISQKFIKGSLGLRLYLLFKSPALPSPGGYYLNPSQPLLALLNQLFTASPDLVWLTIPEGWRREQIGEALVSLINWTPADLQAWNSPTSTDYSEGVFFPDTYLIPVAATPSEVANILIANFETQFAPYQEQFTRDNVLWTTGLKIASLIQRETNNPADMPLISGIIWNRLLTGVKLDIDATLQYAKGKTNDRWWGTVVASDKYLDSPYNTYQNRGLPPTPICNPGLDAIAAAANPTETDCIFYLHDSSGIMHCAVTYQEHLQNIDLYLRNP